jgi:chromosome segregation ATPase
MGEERQSTNQIITKMSAENAEYKLARQNEEEKRALFLRRKAEMEQRLRDFNKMIEELTARKKTLEDELEALREKLQSMLDLLTKRELELNERIKQSEPIHESNKEQNRMNEERLNYMKSHSTEMNNKIGEMNLSKQIMSKNIQKTKHEIDELTSKKNELAFKYEGLFRMNKQSVQTLKGTLQRLNSYESMHKIQFQERSEYLRKLEAQLSDYLLFNRSLGIKYRRIKYDLFNQNMNLINKIEMKLNTFVNLKDKRQIKVLQERMHEALNEYFLLRSKFKQKILIFFKLISFTFIL